MVNIITEEAIVDNLKRDITATFNTQKNVDSAEVIELDLEVKD